jgi:hypothetical protein
VGRPAVGQECPIYRQDCVVLLEQPPDQPRPPIRRSQVDGGLLAVDGKVKPVANNRSQAQKRQPRILLGVGVNGDAARQFQQQRRSAGGDFSPSRLVAVKPDIGRMKRNAFAGLTNVAEGGKRLRPDACPANKMLFLDREVMRVAGVEDSWKAWHIRVRFDAGTFLSYADPNDDFGFFETDVLLADKGDFIAHRDRQADKDIGHEREFTV